MAPKDNQPYDPAPPIPTYDEAIAGSSQYSNNPHSPSPYDDPANVQFESDRLLGTRDAPSGPNNTQSSNHSSRRPVGYRPPTVESDDEYTDSEADGEDDHVRREMQELEIDDGASTRSSLWAKRMPFSLSLPKWSWRWRLPRLPSIRLGERSTPAREGDERPRWRCVPSLSSAATLLMIARVFAILTVMGFLYLLFMSDIFSNMARRLGGGQTFDPESVRIHVQGSVDKNRLRDNLKHFTSYAHLAGSEGDYALATDTKRMFLEYGLEDVTVDEYYVYLNYPTADGRAVQLLGDDGNPTWTAVLEEADRGEGTAGHQTFAFHGHSKSGDVKGPLIYANYGSREDFKRLKDSGIDTEGAIALVKYYGSEGDRALKIKAAELAGFAGCLIYSDPKDDGFLRGDIAPGGHFMPPDGVQRGAVSLMSWVVGDVLTPGWESKQGQPRMKPEQTPGLVQIPSLPLAWKNAQVLLQAIKGFGQKCPEEWEGGVPDTEWWTGNLSGPVVRLKNEQDEVTNQPIWNVYGRIVGIEQPEKSIIIGNHRDAWSYGATDPGSGTAILMEMARIFGDLLARGWRPLRTIEFMSWDAEEYNLIGSTEFVENNLDNLRKDGYVYLNIDTPIIGNELHAAGSPVFQKILYGIIDRIYDPNLNTTLRELWDSRSSEIEGLGAGSDYVAFQDIAGVSSLDLFFDGPDSGAPYHPYHSSYDDFDYVDTVSDPGFTYHGMMAELLGLLILELADRPVLPFDMAAYANALNKWVGELVEWTKNKGVAQAGIDMKELQKAAAEVTAAVENFQDWEHTWQNSVLSANGWEPIRLGAKRCEYNNQMALFETGLLDLAQGGGIPNRTQFRHVVFGPQLWSGYDEAFFPAIRDVVEAGNWTLVNLTVQKTARIIRDAAKPLREWEG